MVYNLLGENFCIFYPFDFFDKFSFSRSDNRDSFDPYVNFALKYNLLIGYPIKMENSPSPLEWGLRLFFRHNEILYPVQICYRKCSKCNIDFDAISVRFPDLYLGIKDMMNNGFKWGLSLPYVDQCPNCGFDENGKGQKFLAIFYEGKVITALDD